jgi:hypothetical protein
MSKPAFVSQIPKNKLEPVFIGGSGENLDKSKQNNGIYVPAHLKNKDSSLYIDSEVKTKQKPVSLDNTNFPSLGGKVCTVVPTTKMNYAEMAKKTPLVQVSTVVKNVSYPSYDKYNDNRDKYWGDEDEEEFEFENEEEYEY